MDGKINNQIVTAVRPVFLSSLVDQFTGSGKVLALTMLYNIFTSYREIDKIDLEGNVVKIMGPYYPVEPLSQLINKLERGVEFARSGGQTISGAMVVSKNITLLKMMPMFNNDIREYRLQTTYLKIWSNYKTLFC